MIDLAGKVVVITGGAGKIGSEFVQTVATNNAVVVIADANEAAGRALANELRKVNGHRVEFHPLDITSIDSAQGMITSLHGKHGRIDALVNNAYPRNSR